MALQVVQGDGRGDHGVHDPFGDFTAFRAPQDRRVGHQVADIAHEHQRAAVQHDVAAVRAGVDTVGVQAAGEGLAALADFFGQRAELDAEPVAVGQHLVLGVHRGDRVFQVEDGGQRGLDHHVGHASGVGLAGSGRAVDQDVDVHPVVHQQHRGRRRGVTLVADELGRVVETGGGTTLQRDDQLAAFDAVASGVLVGGAGQRGGLVEEVAGELDHAGAAHRVVAAGLLGAVRFGDGVGAVQRVVQRAPAGVGGVQRVAGVQDRHHQLRAGLQREFSVHVGGRGLHGLGHRDEVADLRQEGAVGGHVGDGAGVGLVPGVHFQLDAVTLGQQHGVLRREVADDGVEAGPERRRSNAGVRQHFILDEAEQLGGHLQAVDRGACGHGGNLGVGSME